MPKRIALFVLGLVLAIGAFLGYQYVTGSSILGTRKRLPASTIPTTQDGRLSLEMRHPNGDPEYEVRASKAAPTTNPAGPPGAVIPGQYTLTAPSATYYLSDGRLIVVRADRGTLSVDTIGAAGFSGKAPKIIPRGGKLSGNVILTFGPKESFADSSLDLKPGQTQVRLDDDLELNHSDRVLTSPGDIHIRSEQVSFDGGGLTVAYNIEDKRIELLRIDRGNKIIIKNVGAAGLDLGAAKELTKDTKPGSAATRAAARPTATTGPLPAATAAKPESPATTYRLIFGKNVKATWGTRTLTSDQLFILFMAATPEAATRTAKPASPAPEPAPAPGHPAESTTATNQSLATSLPKPQPEDLVVEWTGPMEMRPAGPESLKLLSAKDVVLEALGTRERPVVVTDTPRTVTAGRMWLHAAEQRLEFEPGAIGSVAFVDPAIGQLACQGVTYLAQPGAAAGTGKLHFAGPGRAQVDASVLRREPPTTAAAAPKREPLVASWNSSFDLDLVPFPDPKLPGKTLPGPRRAVLLGNVSIKDPTFSLLSDTLDVFVAATGDPKTPFAFESMLASGNVQVRSARPGSTIDEADKPDGLSTRELHLVTALPAGSKTPVPSLMTALGDVIAWSYEEAKDTPEGSPKKLSRQQISTPKLTVTLEPKDKNDSLATRNPAAGGLGGTAVKQLIAEDGVRVDLERFGQLPVIATATKLTADPHFGKATLDGVVQPNGLLKPARLQQGENQIAGATLLLDQKTQSLEIPGSGEFTFLQPAQKAGDPATPVQITWDKKMLYSGKDLYASFGKSVTARLLGKDDQRSELTCDDGLEVKLGGGTPGTAGAKKTSLAQIIATGHVKAEGSTLDHTGKPITRMFLQSPKLVYTEATKTLDIPAAGSLLIEDYRIDEKTNANGDARGQTAIAWQGHLTFAGATGEITFAKGVKMVHIPLKPIRVVGADPKKPQQVDLNCDDLLARMIQSKQAGGGDTIASPVALGSGGNQKLAKVTASGGATLTMDNNELAAELLDFDALASKATASGKNGSAASFSSPQGRGEADQIIWDLTKDQNAFTLIRPRGNLESPK